MIRPYRPPDLDAVIDTYLSASIVGQDFLPATFWEQDVRSVRELMPQAQTWVVEVDDEVVAFISTLGNVIGGLFTKPGHQGRGHGRALIERVRRQHESLQVEVFAANTNAIRFYRNRGFSEVDRQINVESGLPLLIMECNSDPSSIEPG